MTQSDCPSDGELRAFADGRVAEDSFEAIASHIESCPACRTTVDGLESRGDTLLATLRNVEQQTFSAADAALLDALSRAKQLAPSAAVAPAADSAKLPLREETHPNAVRDYELLELLGRGGMGDVFRARHQQTRRLKSLRA